VNIQIYASKKNPGVLKAERFFKERRIPFQTVDLKKCRLGERELQLFAKAAGSATALVDRAGMKALERPVAHLTTDSLILGELLNDPLALVSPIVRNGNAVTIGVDEAAWAAWLTDKQKA
jgi:arsenate reductase (glutaredoxin)